MRSLSLRTRLLLWSSAASVVTLTLVVLLVDLTFRANIREQLSSGLELARQVADAARTGRMGDRISEAAGLALDTRLRAAVATGDVPTISQTLQELFGATPGWAAVVGRSGMALASTASAPRAALSRAGPLLSEALYYDTADLWGLDTALHEVSASAILFGAEPLAVLVRGRPVGPEDATAIEIAAGRTVALVVGSNVMTGASRADLGEDARAELAAWASRAPGAPEPIDLGSERAFVTSLPLLSNNGRRVGTMVLMSSYDDALRPSIALRTALLVLLVAGLTLTLFVSGVFSRGVTVPVARLLRDTERLGRGDLETPVEPVRDDEIGRLAASFETMRVSLRDANAELIRTERLSAIGQAASAVAHDFTQPLSAIAGAVGLLRMESDDPGVRDRCFSAIDAELDRLQRMKQEIVEFARGESRIDEARIRVDSFLENTLSALRTQWAKDGISVSIEHGASGEWLIDSYRLGRMIENLVRNAAAAIGKDGTITVRSRMEGESLVLEVEDDGPGIPRERLDDIFEPFVSFGKKEGSGLGLAIARNVVRQHGGTISVASDPNGTRFAVVLPPRASAPAPDPDAEPREAR